MPLALLNLASGVSCPCSWSASRLLIRLCGTIDRSGQLQQGLKLVQHAWAATVQDLGSELKPENLGGQTTRLRA